MSEDEQPSNEPDHRPKATTERPSTGYRYFPASPITPGRWNPADLRIRLPSRRSR